MPKPNRRPHEIKSNDVVIDVGDATGFSAQVEDKRVANGVERMEETEKAVCDERQVSQGQGAKYLCHRLRGDLGSRVIGRRSFLTGGVATILLINVPSAWACHRKRHVSNRWPGYGGAY